MSDLMDINLEEFQPAEPLTDGNYQVDITYAGMFRSTKETQRPYIRIMAKAQDNEDAEAASGMISFPIDDDDRSTSRLMQKNLIEFCECFGLDKTEFMTSSKEALAELDSGTEKVRIAFIEGSSGLVKVITETNEGVERNVIKSYLK